MHCVLRSAGDYLRARKQLRRAVELDASNELARKNLAAIDRVISEREGEDQ